MAALEKIGGRKENGSATSASDDFCTGCVVGVVVMFVAGAMAERGLAGRGDTGVAAFERIDGRKENGNVVIGSDDFRTGCVSEPGAKADFEVERAEGAACLLDGLDGLAVFATLAEVEFAAVSGRGRSASDFASANLTEELALVPLRAAKRANVAAGFAPSSAVSFDTGFGRPCVLMSEFCDLLSARVDCAIPVPAVC